MSFHVITSCIHRWGKTARARIARRGVEMFILVVTRKFQREKRDEKRDGMEGWQSHSEVFRSYLGLADSDITSLLAPP